MKSTKFEHGEVSTWTRNNNVTVNNNITQVSSEFLLTGFPKFFEIYNELRLQSLPNKIKEEYPQAGLYLEVYSVEWTLVRSTMKCDQTVDFTKLLGLLNFHTFRCRLLPLTVTEQCSQDQWGQLNQVCIAFNSNIGYNIDWFRVQTRTSCLAEIGWSRRATHGTRFCPRTCSSSFAAWQICTSVALWSSLGFGGFLHDWLLWIYRFTRLSKLKRCQSMQWVIIIFWWCWLS